MRMAGTKLAANRALTRKETRQIIRDPSSIAIGIVFPLMLILLFGYGMSLDVTKVSVAVLDNDRSADSVALIGAFRLVALFRGDAGALDGRGDDARARPEGRRRCCRSRPTSAGAGTSATADVQILVNGTDANQARIMQAYAAGPIAAWSAEQPARGCRCRRPGIVIRPDVVQRSQR